MKKKFIIGGVILAVVVFLISFNIVKSKSTGVFSNGKAVEVKLTEAKVKDINALVSANGVFEEVEKEEIYFDTPVKVTKVYVSKDQHVNKGDKLFDIDLDDLNSQLNQARVNLRIQQMNLDNAQKNQDQQAQMPAQNTLPQGISSLLGGGQSVESLNEQVKLAQLRVKDLETRISKLVKQTKSPISGTITELNVQKGSSTSPALKAAKIINPDNLQVRLDVKELDIAKVKEDQEVDITGDAFSGKTIKGTVKSIGTVAKKKQGLNTGDEAFVDVVITVSNLDKDIKPGLSVNAKVITGTKKDAVVIPFDALQEDKDGNKWVFVDDNGIARQKTVTVGIGSGLDLEVISGVKGNDKLVQDPPSRLKDGMKITVQNSDKK